MTPTLGTARTTRGRQEFLSPEEVLAVLKQAKERDTRSWCMATLSYKHGLRASECCSLRLEDLELRGETGTLFVRRCKGSISYRYELTRQRGFPILNSIDAVKTWLKERGNDPSPFLFPTQKSSHMDPSSWNRIFKGIALAAGIDQGRAHPHIFRHSRGAHLAKGHADLLEIKAALGHASINSTAIYTHVGPQAADIAMKKVDAEIF